MRECMQSYLVATDQVGLELLLRDSQVFACFENMHDTIYHSELGSSKLILDAGFNIDSLMVRVCICTRMHALCTYTAAAVGSYLIAGIIVLHALALAGQAFKRWPPGQGAMTLLENTPVHCMLSGMRATWSSLQFVRFVNFFVRAFTPGVRQPLVSMICKVVKHGCRCAIRG